MGCKTRRSKHLFRSRQTLGYKKKKKQTRREYVGGAADVRTQSTTELLQREPTTFTKNGEEDPPKTLLHDDPTTIKLENTNKKNDDKQIIPPNDKPIIFPNDKPIIPPNDKPITPIDGSIDVGVWQKTADLFSADPLGLGKTVSFATQAVNKVITSEVNKIADKLHIDPNLSAEAAVSEAADKLEKISDVLDTPAGDKLKAEAGAVADKFVAESLGPASEMVSNIGDDLAQNASESAANAALNAVGVIPGVGEAAEAIRVGANAVQIGTASLDAAAQLTEVGTDTMLKVNEAKNDAENILEKATNLTENLPKVPEINIPKVELPEINIPKVELPDVNIPKVELPDINRKQVNQGGGGMRTLSHLQKAGKRIENRLQSSLKEFNKNTKTRKKVRFNL
jgi:hypothetical protein